MSTTKEQSERFFQGTPIQALNGKLTKVNKDVLLDGGFSASHLENVQCSVLGVRRDLSILKIFGKHGFGLVVSTDDCHGALIEQAYLLSLPSLSQTVECLAFDEVQKLLSASLQTLSWVDRYLEQWPLGLRLFCLILEVLPGGFSQRDCHRCFLEFISEQSSGEIVKKMSMPHQGPISSRLKSRLARELVQRECAKSKVKAARREVPKHLREAAIKEARYRKEFENSFAIREEGLFGFAKDVFFFPYNVAKGASALSRAAIQISEAIDGTVSDPVLHAVAGSVAGSVVNIAHTANQRSQHIVNSIDRVADNTSGVAAKIKEVIEQIQTFLTKDLPHLAVQVLLGGFLAYLFHKFKAPVARLAIVSVAGLLFAKDVCALFSAAFLKGDELSIVEESGFSGFFTQTVSMIFMTTLFSAERPPTWSALCNKVTTVVGNLPRLEKGIESLVQFLMDAVERSVNAVREYIGMHPVRIFRKFAAEVEAKLEESNIFFFEIISGKLKDRLWSDAAIYNKFLTYIEYFTLVRKETVTGSSIRAEVDRHIAKLMRLAEPFKASMNAAGGFRPQPVTVVLAGLPGIGKTTVTQSLCLTVMKLCGHLSDNADVTEASRSIFMKPANSKYMDGYTNQFAYLIDDLFQIKPVPGTEGGEIEDIMTHHGPISASLNMADLPKKGMYPFVSRMILCTTNATELEAQVGVSGIILSKDALERRFDHHVIMQVKPQYRLPGSHMLDYQKFKEEEQRAPDSMHAYPWHIWEVQDTKFDGRAEFQPGSGRCMIQFIDEIVSHIKYNEESHATSQATFERIIKAPVSTWADRPVRQESTSSQWQCHELQSIEEDEEFLENTVGLDECDELAMLEALTEDYVKHSRKGSPEDVMAPDKILYLIREADAGSTNRMKKYFHDTFSKFSWKTTVTALKYCSIAAVALTAVVFMVRAGYETLHHFFFGKPVAEESNGPKVRTAHCFKQEMIVTQNGNADVPGLWYNVYKNTYKVLLEQADGDYKVLGQLLVLEGTTFVMPFHFIKDMEKSKQMGFMTDNSYIVFRSCAIQRHEIRVKMGDFLNFRWHIERERDLAFSTFGNAIARKRSIVHFLMRDATISDQGGKAARLDTARVTSKGELLEFSERVSYFSQNIEVSRGRVKYIGTYPNGTEHRKWIRYHAETLPGDCGAVLSITDHASTACQFVIGLHVGRREGSDEAYATQLDREIADRALAIFGSRVVPEVPFDEINNQSDYRALGIEVQPTSELPFTEGDTGTFGSFVPVCEVSKGVVSPIESTKQITVLGIEQFFEEQIKDLSGAQEVPELEVMKLKSYKDENGTIIFPMAEALRPFAGNTLFVPEKKFERAVFVAMKPFSDATLEFPSRVLTFDEAVVGVPAMEFSSIPRSTSLGYPWCTAARNKAYFFGKSEVYDLTTPEAMELKRQVHELEDTLKSGRRPLFLCRDFLKDEVRKKGKGARLIAGTDVRYYILCRMYFGAFVSALIRTHQKSGACLGVNQYAEWSWLREFITRKGDKVWDGDFAGFDSSQQPQMLWAILHFINSWYDLHGSGDSNEIRKILFMDLVHSRHLVSVRGKATKVVEWVKSLPSGHFLTSTVNTILSMSCLVGAYIGLTGRVDFWEHAGVAAQGDDNLVNADDFVIAEYNQVTCAQYLREEYGLVYTAGRKGEELKPFMGIEDVIFLQRTFRKKNGVDVCPIRPESFLHSLYYTQRNKEKEVQRQDMHAGLERALEELALYPEDKWRFTSRRIFEAMKDISVSPQFDISTSEAYFQAVLSRVPEYL